MGKKYAIRDKEAMYFISFATVGWIDVFSRKEYRDILIENLRYCQQNKGLIIYSWCIMSNHLHLVQASDSNLSDILRDFKSYTAKVLLNAIQTLPESRREWMLKVFKEEGERNGNNTNYGFWRQDNQFKEVHSKDFAFQKFEYIHNNPVEARIVEKAEEYIYSNQTKSFIKIFDNNFSGQTTFQNHHPFTFIYLQNLFFFCFFLLKSLALLTNKNSGITGL